ncbi:MAG: zinc-binding dehydrogenase, partial [Chloroflexi bacterium]|nr:zinc-binding dehydrogenase [Chloroflexota bacterium]
LGCGHCEFCLAGEQVHCADYSGIARAGRGADAEWTVIPEPYCYHLPAELSFVEGTFIACTGATAYGSLRKLTPSGRDTLAVFGLGPVGLSHILVAKALGARVIGVDVLSERLAFARQLGADETVNAGQDDPAAAIRALTRGRGAEMAVEATGNAKAQAQAVQAVCVHGKVSYVGRSHGAPAISPEPLILKEVTLMGSAVLPGHLYWELTRFMLDRRVRFEAIVTQRRPLEEGPQAFTEFDAGGPGKFVLAME